MKTDLRVPGRTVQLSGNEYFAPISFAAPVPNGTERSINADWSNGAEPTRDWKAEAGLPVVRKARLRLGLRLCRWGGGHFSGLPTLSIAIELLCRR